MIHGRRSKPDKSSFAREIDLGHVLLIQETVYGRVYAAGDDSKIQLRALLKVQDLAAPVI